MKYCKKVMAVFLALLLLLLSLSACGAGKTSNLMMEELRDKTINEEEERENFVSEETNDGFTFSYEGEFAGFAETKLEGIADKKQCVKRFSYSQTHVNVEKLKSIDSTEFISLASKGDFSDMPLGELISVSFLGTCMAYITSFIGEDAGVADVVYTLLDSRESEIETNGWRHSIQINETENVALFSAEYVGG